MTEPVLLIVWHSRTGGTAQLVQAAADGAAVAPSVTVRRVAAAEAGADDVLAADGLLLAAPENLAALSGMMKEFLDRTYYALLDRRIGLPYATMVCAGSDGDGATRQFDRIATGLRLRRVAEPLIVNTDAQTPERIAAPKRIAAAGLERARELGGTLAAGLEQGLW
jgi:multimeric flavodoxin WrbA